MSVLASAKVSRVLRAVVLGSIPFPGVSRDVVLGSIKVPRVPSILFAKRTIAQIHITLQLSMGVVLFSCHPPSPPPPETLQCGIAVVLCPCPPPSPPHPLFVVNETRTQGRKMRTIIVVNETHCAKSIACSPVKKLFAFLLTPSLPSSHAIIFLCTHAAGAVNKHGK